MTPLAIALIQALLQELPEFEAVWPGVQAMLAGQQPSDAQVATMWAAATAAHARVQAAAAPAAAAAVVHGAISGPA